MSDSDPDLLDLDDLPDTARVGNDPLLAAVAYSRLREVIAGLGRWAKRQQKERAELKSLARSLVLAVAAGAIGVMTSMLGAALYVGGRMERFEALGERVQRLEARADRGWHRVDSTTHATEGE